MKTTTTEATNPIDFTSPHIALSFYEENYILEPADMDADNHFFDYEGDMEEAYQVVLEC